MTRERPVTYKEFTAILRSKGFTMRPSTGTSHEQWVRDNAHGFRKVTVDKHHAPFHRNMLKLMLRQAGWSKSQFFKWL